jgi:hypothetical protein
MAAEFYRVTRSGASFRLLGLLWAICLKITKVNLILGKKYGKIYPLILTKMIWQQFGPFITNASVHPVRISLC